jgi:xylulokinase
LNSDHASLVVAYDVGTSSVKAALFDRGGRIHGAASEGYPLSLPQPGHAEQNPADWWQAMGAATKRLLAGVPGSRERVEAVGIAAQVCGTIPLDKTGAPLHPCLTAMDTRSAGIARAITAGGPRIAGYGALRLLGWLHLANGAPNLAGRDPLSKMLWLREERPAIWERTAHVADVKDWLIHRLTGNLVTTPDIAQLTWLMDNRVGRRAWSARYLTRFRLDRSLLPTIIESDAVAGELTAGAAAHLGLYAGLPVAGGTSDINACALAAGDLTEGVYHLSVGTSLWLGVHSRRRRVDARSAIATLCSAVSDRYLLVAAQESAGAAVTWAARVWGFGEGMTGLHALDDAAATATPCADTPQFMPWLAGERAPADDARLRGSLAGATLRTTRADLAYAVLAGVALNARWAFSNAARCIPPVNRPMKLMGGGATSATWTRIFADMLQQPLQIIDRPELGGARGAAMTAARVAGWYASLDEATRMASVGALVEPNRARGAWAEDRFERLTEYWRATRRWQADLSTAF